MMQTVFPIPGNPYRYPLWNLLIFFSSNRDLQNWFNRSCGGDIEKQATNGQFFSEEERF